MLVRENSAAVQLKFFEAHVLMDLMFWMEKPVGTCC